MHLFDILFAISSGKVREMSGIFICLERGSPGKRVWEESREGREGGGMDKKGTEGPQGHGWERKRSCLAPSEIPRSASARDEINLSICASAYL